MNINSKNLILLTGSGFTKNFGGFLGYEMWSLIFNHPLIQSNAKLKEILVNEPNYELAYNDIINDSGSSEEEINIIKKAVEETYSNLDDNIKKWNFNNDNPTSLNIYGFRKFITRFIGSDSNEQGFFFTLNQDIFMEREQFGYIPLGMSKLSHIPIWDFKREHYKIMPSVEVVNSMQDISNYGNLLYVKLHGSYGWLSSNNQTQMVIGSNKLDHINKEPLLKWYLEIFNNVINSGNKKIVIVGYGFADEHINDIILAGIKNHNLKVIVINPINFTDFKTIIQDKISDSVAFFNALAGYFPHTLVDIFPHDQNQHPTAIYQNIERSIVQ